MLEQKSDHPFRSRFTDKFSISSLAKDLVNEILKCIDKKTPHVLFLGNSQITSLVKENLSRKNIKISILEFKDIPTKEKIFEFISKIERPSAILLGVHRNIEAQKLATYLVSSDDLKNIPLIYKILEHEEYSLIKEYDVEPSREFITSIFDDGILEEIYRESISKVPMKCTVRKAFDLYQALLGSLKLEGDIIEFGSYNGHSGYLMARILEKYGIKKDIYLCDTFSYFPKEKGGLDYFWSDTHYVDFEKVKKLFRDMPNVHLIKGDFRQTFNSMKDKKFSLIYVDCDSYDGTKFVCENAFNCLVEGGFIIFEDYGHEALLGVRVAVDNFFKNRSDVVRFFSFFAGIQIIMKRRE